MKKLLGVVSVLVIIAVAVIWLGQTKDVPRVTLHNVTAATVERTVKCNGVIAPTSYQTVVPPTSCVIDDIEVQVGDVVKTGDTLFRIDTAATKELLLENEKMSETAFAALLNKKEYTAPINGIVTEIRLYEDVVNDVSKSGLVIAATDHLEVSLKVPESMLKDVWIGQSAVVRGEGFSKDAYRGTVTFLSATANVSTGGTLLDATVSLRNDELDDSLRLGLSAKVYLLAETFEKGIVIPYSCLQLDEEGEYVFTVVDDIVTKRRVTVQAELTQGAVIGSGVAEGDQLVENAEQYTEGQAVTVA